MLWIYKDFFIVCNHGYFVNAENILFRIVINPVSSAHAKWRGQTLEGWNRNLLLCEIVLVETYISKPIRQCNNNSKYYYGWSYQAQSCLLFVLVTFYRYVLVRSQAYISPSVIPHTKILMLLIPINGSAK